MGQSANPFIYYLFFYAIEIQKKIIFYLLSSQGM